MYGAGLGVYDGQVWNTARNGIVPIVIGILLTRSNPIPDGSTWNSNLINKTNNRCSYQIHWRISYFCSSRIDAKVNDNYLYDTSIIEQFPPKPVGGTAGTFTLTASHVSLEPGSISPLLTSFNFYYIVRTFISSVSIYNVKNVMYQ